MLEIKKVNIAVISYNSQETILETLNSILIQSYGTNNIELIISDDGSTDKTVSLVNKWVEENKYKFFNVKLFLNEKNNGVSKNCNIAWRACEQDWVKSIAADDVLLPGCISSFMNFVTNNPEAKVVFSYMEWFGNKVQVTPKNYQLDFFSYDSLKQNEYLKYFSFNIAPTSFINVSALKEVGFADEKYKLFEDLPLWLNFTSKGIRLYFNNEVTVRYRIGESISKKFDKFINKEFINNCITLNEDCKKAFFPSYQWFLKKEELFLLRYQLFLAGVFNNKKNPSNFFYIMGWILVPITILSRIKLMISK